MTQDTHNKYFKNIDYNTDESVDWKGGDRDGDRDGNRDGPILKGTDYPLLSSITADAYEARIVYLIGRCKHARRAEDLVEGEGEGEGEGERGQVVCVWINVDPDPEYSPPPFEPIAKFFGIVHHYHHHYHYYYHYHHHHHHHHQAFGMNIKEGLIRVSTNSTTTPIMSFFSM